VYRPYHFGVVFAYEALLVIVVSTVFELEGDRENFLAKIQQGVERGSDGKAAGEKPLAQSTLVGHRLRRTACVWRLPEIRRQNRRACG